MGLTPKVGNRILPRLKFSKYKNIIGLISTINTEKLKKITKNKNISSSWLIKKGINKKIANNYISELFLSLSQDAVNKKSQGFKKLVADSQTPGGLNMQVLKELKRAKFYNKFIKALENINKRVSN